jgi:glycosyltransferase involved in cell wall biosynthesis
VGRRLSQADAIVGCSEFITDRVRRLFPRLADRCLTILNAVDEAPYERAPIAEQEPERTTTRLCFVGRLSPEKGVHTLLAAFALVLERHPNVELDIFGPAEIPSFREVAVMRDARSMEELSPFYDDRERYASWLRELCPPAARERVHFRGPVPHQGVHRVFREADIAIFCPIWEEPFGLPVIEAMRAERPVVATRVGGIPELVEDHRTALLVEPANPIQLAAALTELLDDPILMQRLGRAGRQHVEQSFSWTARVDEWTALYERILTEPVPSVSRRPRRAWARTTASARKPN